MQFELSILDLLQNCLQSNFLDDAMPIITRLGDGGIIWCAAAVILLAVPKTRRIGAAVIISLALEAVCCNLILKPLVERPRPCDINTAFNLLIPRPTDYSFPSGHTGAAFAAVYALYFAKSRLWLPACILAALIAFSRLYLYVHYPTDILAGVILGIISGRAAKAIISLCKQPG